MVETVPSWAHVSSRHGNSVVESTSGERRGACRVALRGPAGDVGVRCIIHEPAAARQRPNCFGPTGYATWSVRAVLYKSPARMFA